MVRQGLAAGAVALTLSGCCPAPEPQAPPFDLAALLPEARVLDGWTIDASPELYAPETLYEILNGGAERYLAHGFRSMVCIRYRHGDEPGTVTLEVYDMGDRAGAFGIYSAAAASSATWSRSATVAFASRLRCSAKGQPPGSGISSSAPTEPCRPGSAIVS